jgi:hypothetical protein
MSDPWIFGLLSLIAFAVLLCFTFAGVSESTGGNVRRTVRCPEHGREVTAVFSADYFQTKRYKDVIACSAFADPSRVSCSKACLDLDKSSLATKGVAIA